MSSRSANHRICGCCLLRPWGRDLLWGMLLLAVILCPPVRGEPFVEEFRSLPPGLAGSSSPDIEVLYEGGLMAGNCVPFQPPNTSQRGTYLFADALFWTVREGGADNWAQVITPKGLLGSYVGTATLVDAPFDWNTGFRVGVGHQRVGDEVDATVYYTNFKTKATSQAAGEVYSAFLGNFYVDNTDGDSFGPHYRSASIRWDFDFHTIDLEVRRSFTIAPNLVVRPFVGLKAAIISQSLSSNWRQPIDTSEKTYLFNSATENLKQDFWGIGPSLGVTLEMPLSTRPRYSLKLFGTPSGSLMFGHWTFRDVYTNDGPTSTTVPTPTSIAINTSPITGAATMVSGVMGIQWTQYFSRATTTVRVGYEAQVWLNQMQFYSYNMGRLNNLTSLHGGILELCINY